MRAATRAYFANHPLLALLLVIVRWVFWFCVGHPVGVSTGIWALALGLPFPVVVVAAPVLDVGVNGLAMFTDGWIGRRFRVLTLAARFQRRWPAAFSEASQQRPHDRPVIFSGRYFAAPDGLRPVLTSPRIRINLLSVTRTQVTWEVRPWSAHRFGEFSVDADLVALADDRVLGVQVASQSSSRRRRWDLTIQFFDSVADPEADGDRVVNDGFISPGSNGNGLGPLPRRQPLPEGEGDDVYERHNGIWRMPNKTQRPDEITQPDKPRHSDNAGRTHNNGRPRPHRIARRGWATERH